MAEIIKPLNHFKWIVRIEEIERDKFRFEAEIYRENYEEITGLWNDEIISSTWTTKRAATKAWIAYAKENKISNYEFKK